MLDQIQSLSGKADALEKEIFRLFQSFDTTVTTIPGVGPIIGAVILSEVGDISRFSSADKLAAYIGVDPSVNQSGEFQAAHFRPCGIYTIHVDAAAVVSAQMHLDGVSGRYTARSYVPCVLREESRRRAQIHDDHRPRDEENDRRGICHSA